MNQLQEFMAECNRQTREVYQEEFILNGSKFFGTFGDPQMLPSMERHGHDDQLVIPLLSPSEQYASPPLPRQKLIRSVNNQEYFIQMVDAKNPVVYTFILVDREP